MLSGDSDWAGNPNDRPSSSGYGIFLSKILVSWSDKKKNVVACSSTKDDYRSLALAIAELYWIRMLFRELGNVL